MRRAAVKVASILAATAVPVGAVVAVAHPVAPMALAAPAFLLRALTAVTAAARPPFDLLVAAVAGPVLPDQMALRRLALVALERHRVSPGHLSPALVAVAVAQITQLAAVLVARAAVGKDAKAQRLTAQLDLQIPEAAVAAGITQGLANLVALGSSSFE